MPRNLTRGKSFSRMAFLRQLFLVTSTFFLLWLLFCKCQPNIKRSITVRNQEQFHWKRTWEKKQMYCNEILICHCDPNVRENNAGNTRIFSIILTNVTSVLDRIQTLFVRKFNCLCYIQTSFVCSRVWLPVFKKKRHESESVYASESDFVWCQKVFQHRPYHDKNILILGDGVERLSEDQRLPELALTFGYPYGSSLFPIFI